MLIEEIVRSCVNDRVAEAAVASIGRKFLAEIRERAQSYGMSVGEFTSLSVRRFARHGDEAELRSVQDAMKDSQEPVLSGLHRILCIMLAAGGHVGERRARDRAPRIAAQLCAMDADRFRELRA